MTETFQTPRPAMPVQPQAAEIPSRAAQKQPEPMFSDPPPRDKKGRRIEGKAPRKQKPKLPSRKAAVAALSAAEIAKLNAKRMRAMVRKKKKASTTKNPNRPLEAKNRLQVVLSMTNQLRRPELLLFAALVDKLQGVSRGARKRLIGALAQVYP